MPSRFRHDVRRRAGPALRRPAPAPSTSQDGLRGLRAAPARPTSRTHVAGGDPLARRGTPSRPGSARRRSRHGHQGPAPPNAAPGRPRRHDPAPRAPGHDVRAVVVRDRRTRRAAEVTCARVHGDSRPRRSDVKRMLPVEELARDERFQHMSIEEVVFDPATPAPSARDQRPGADLRERQRQRPLLDARHLRRRDPGARGRRAHLLGLRHRRRAASRRRSP